MIVVTFGLIALSRLKALYILSSESTARALGAALNRPLAGTRSVPLLDGDHRKLGQRLQVFLRPLPVTVLPGVCHTVWTRRTVKGDVWMSYIGRCSQSLCGVGRSASHSRDRATGTSRPNTRGRRGLAVGMGRLICMVRQSGVQLASLPSLPSTAGVKNDRSAPPHHCHQLHEH